jgi:cytochrome b pre-mRNA-processing protein 3
MILFPFRRNPRAATIAKLYGAIVAQARQPAFYRDYAVPDTVEARLDMIILHLALVTRRFGDDAASRGLGQGIFDAFCQDIDDNLREMGVGDLAVPKQMRRVGEAYFGRAAAYRQALEEPGGPGLAEAISRNIYGSGALDSAGAARLTAYVTQAARQLAAQEAGAFHRGQIDFPDPESMPAHSGRNAIPA